MSDSRASPPTEPAFLATAGPLGALIAATDWTATPIGPPASWPVAIRVVLATMLDSPQPMFLCWGPALSFFFNAAYAPFLGARRDRAMGRPFAEVWPDVWHDVEPIVAKALAGRGSRFEDMPLTMTRNGFEEQTWWSFTYMPLRDEHGAVVGMLCTTIDTTEKVLLGRRAQREREQQKQMLQQMPGFAALLCEREHRFEYANDAFQRLAGGRALIGRTVREAFPELAGQGFHELLDEVYRTGEPFVSQAMRVELDNDAPRFIDLLYHPMRDDAGAVTGIFAGGYDVTDRIGAERELRGLNNDLEREVIARTQARGQTWRVTPDLLAVLGDDTHFADVNPAWTTTLGWTASELKSRPFVSFVHPDDVGATERAYAAVRRGEPVLRFENRYRCKDGRYCWLSWVAVPEGGKYYCTARDTTAQKAAEQERDRLWALSEDMLARADYGGGMVAVNPAWTKVLGYSEHQLLTRPYAEIIHPDNVGVTIAALQSMGETGLPTRFENRILASNGEWKPIGWTVSPEPDGTHFIAVGRDLADDKAREQTLLQTQADLRQAQKMEAVGQLTGGIAHDFNNLLAAMSLSLQMLSRRTALGQYDVVEKYVGLTQTAVKRAASLTQRLLAFSRRQTLDPKPLDVNRLAAGMEELIRRTVGPSVHLEVVGAGGLWPVNVDGPQLESSLLNLCINARDAMLPDGGNLTIETANKWLDDRAARERELTPGQYVSVCVSDTGAGMSPEIAARAFDPFFTTKPIGQGTGLGLSMVYGFVRQSGGQVRIYSEAGQGTTMSMYFPRHLGEAVVAEPEPGDEPLTAGDGQVVLLIDDESTIRSVVAEMLAESGYQVLQAEDGPSGLKLLAAARRIDLLITDVGLPGGMNGRQVADAARVARPDMNVLFITGYAENAAVGNGHLDPGMQVLTKPFDMTTLANKVDTLLHQPAGRG